MVVYGHREYALRALLADHVLVEGDLDLAGLGNARRAGADVILADLLGDDVVAQLDALVADVDRGAGDQLLDFALALPAEGARQVRVVVTLLHDTWPPPLLRFPPPLLSGRGTNSLRRTTRS